MAARAIFSSSMRRGVAVGFARGSAWFSPIPEGLSCNGLNGSLLQRFLRGILGGMVAAVSIGSRFLPLSQRGPQSALTRCRYYPNFSSLQLASQFDRSALTVAYSAIVVLQYSRAPRKHVSDSFEREPSTSGLRDICIFRSWSCVWPWDVSFIGRI